MKKIALLLFVAFQVASINAQQSIKFKMGYKPSTTYKITSDQKSSTSISYGADMEPMVQEAAINMIQTFKTGKLTGNSMPIVMTMVPEKGSDAAAVMPNGATIYGSVKNENQVQFDSISGDGMQEQTKSMMMTMIKTMASQYVVPERTVKVGESFSVDVPMDMPMGPITMKMNTKTTYKLVKIEGKKAFFDLVTVIDISGDMSGQEMKGSGSGTGLLVYDIDKNFFTEQTGKSTSTMAFEAQGMKMNIAATQDINMKAEVSAN